MAIKSAEELLTLVVERLKPIKPKKVILFGSYAKGEADEFSDEFEKMIKDENPFIQKALEEGIVVELEN
jgi:predicted nucleotidyltransferase